MIWPAGAVIALDGENIDGESNALVSHGDDAYSWHNSGSFATDFVRSTVAGTPLVKKQTGLSCVAFDGRSDILTASGSAVALAFLHTSGVFDLALVFRRMGTRAVSGCRLFGTEGKGLGIYSDGYLAGSTVEGGFGIFLSNGVLPIVSLDTQELDSPIGEVVGLFIRGDGTQIEVTEDFWNYERQTFQAALGAGNAAHDYGLGSTGGNSGATTNFASVDVLDARLWSRNLTAAELDIVRANFTTRKAAA